MTKISSGDTNYLNVYNDTYSKKENKKCAKQRAINGFCKREVWEIDTWFFRIIPRMLECFIKTKDCSFPVFLKDEFYNTFKDSMPMSQEIFYMGYSINDDEKEKEIFKKSGDWCYKRWNSILNRMLFLFNECNEETCSKQNQYYDEYMKYLKLQKNKTQPPNLNVDNSSRLLERNSQENNISKNIFGKFMSRQRELENYRAKCKKEELTMFCKYLYYLWD